VEQRKLLAALYLERRLFDLAEREYRRILELAPQDTEIWEKLIETHLEIGTPSETVPDLAALASLYVESGRLKDAVATYRKILDIDVDNVDILERYIEAYVQIGLEQDLVDDYLHLATLQSQRGNIKRAMEIYYHLREIAPQDDRVDRGLEETGAIAKLPSLPRGKSAKPSGPADSNLAEFIEEKEGESYGAELQLEKTVQNYKNILKLNPENPAVRANSPTCSCASIASRKPTSTGRMRPRISSPAATSRGASKFMKT
jgi:tetratricopeptide (TPR) repeat protein